VATAQAAVALLRGEVAGKKNRLQRALRHPEISPEVLRFLEGGASKPTVSSSAGFEERLAAEATAQQQNSQLSAELRQALGLGWDSSPDYLLIRKAVLKDLDFDRITPGGPLRVTEAARDVLALSPDEQSALGSALDDARDAAWARVQRTEPSGDVVAQLTFPSLDAAFDQNLSNRFAGEVAAALGPERTDLFLQRAWRDLQSELAPSDDETMTIRQTEVDGQPDLLCEMKMGGKVDVTPLRFAHYPYGPILTFFPMGWDTLAQQEGFTLPPRFYGQQ
jgi:hypothetical protein